MLARRLLVLLVLPAPGLSAQTTDSSRLTVARIYRGSEFRAASFGPLRWLQDGAAYSTLEAPAGGKAGRDLVRYETASGARSILVPAARFIPAGQTEPLDIESYGWSADGFKLLVFTNSERVWRTNTRGDYWVLDRRNGRLTKLG